MRILFLIFVSFFAFTDDHKNMYQNDAEMFIAHKLKRIMMKLNKCLKEL